MLFALLSCAVAQPLNKYYKINDMSTPKDNNENITPSSKPFVPGEMEEEQHLNFTGAGEDNTEPADPVNKPEHHITKEEFDERESGQSSSSAIPPPDDAPRGL